MCPVWIGSALDVPPKPGAPTNRAITIAGRTASSFRSDMNRFQAGPGYRWGKTHDLSKRSRQWPCRRDQVGDPRSQESRPPMPASFDDIEIGQVVTLGTTVVDGKALDAF